MDKIQNNKRIARNTLLLYFRMAVLMLVSLYTSRVVLNALGVEDYGIYNVVGGLVAMFSLISGSLTSSISRFFTYELGTEDKSQLKLNKIFYTSVSIQILLSLLIVITAETLGLWFLNFKMVIPNDRIIAANWCFQLSIISFVLSLLSTPYNAVIIAHEKMSAFAYISIIEAIGKLLVAFSVLVAPIDKLIIFSLLTSIIAWGNRILYTVYCKKKFPECKYKLDIDLVLLKKMLSFSGWTFIGVSSYILKEQGCNILINLFCGPAVNAARGIANSVNNAISGFVHNFMIALDPQITKSYASKDYEYMFNLAIKGSRFSYYILLLITLPVLLNTHYILELWLKNVPEHTVYFVQLILFSTLLESFSNTLVTIMLATGKIKKYQLLVGGLQMLNFPISYIALSIGMVPEVVILIAIVIGFACFISRLVLLQNMVGLDAKKYLSDVLFHSIYISCLAVIIPWTIKCNMEEGLLNFFLVSFISIMVTMVVIYSVGCDKSEKAIIKSKVIAISNKFLK